MKTVLRSKASHYKDSRVAGWSKRSDLSRNRCAVDVKTERPQGIHHLPIAQTSFAILDFETTGLYAGADRVVEVSILRIDPGSEPRLVLDTLINPRRRVTATEIHGITDADVADAPTFRDVAAAATKAIAGCVVASYNISFDMPFLTYELADAGIRVSMPHMCLMYMRPMLSLGKRCRLDEACRHHGIRLHDAHTAAGDAIASAKLMGVYLKTMKQRKIQTFAELAALHQYKFTSSFHVSPLANSPAGREKSRRTPQVTSRVLWHYVARQDAADHCPSPYLQLMVPMHRDCVVSAVLRTGARHPLGCDFTMLGAPIPPPDKKPGRRWPEHHRLRRHGASDALARGQLECRRRQNDANRGRPANRAVGRCAIHHAHAPPEISSRVKTNNRALPQFFHHRPHGSRV